MTADPTQPHEEDATDQGVSATEPAEGADDTPGGSPGSPARQGGDVPDER